jgi:hypothetical protein
MRGILRGSIEMYARHELERKILMLPIKGCPESEDSTNVGTVVIQEDSQLGVKV